MYQNIERSFSPPSFERQLTIQVDTPKSYSVVQKRGLYTRVYDLLDARRAELDIDRHLVLVLHLGRPFARLEPHQPVHRLPRRRVAQHRDHRRGRATRSRRCCPVEPGVKFTIGRSMRGHSGSGTSVEIELTGDRTEILEILADQVAATLSAISRRSATSTPRWRAATRRSSSRPSRERALQAGLSTQSVGATIVGSALVARGQLLPHRRPRAWTSSSSTASRTAPPSSSSPRCRSPVGPFSAAARGTGRLPDRTRRSHDRARESARRHPRHRRRRSRRAHLRGHPPGAGGAVVAQLSGRLLLGHGQRRPRIRTRRSPTRCSCCSSLSCWST